MKIISWNLNGIRAAGKKGLADFINRQKAEIYCFQEVRAKENQISDELKNIEGYYFYLNPAAAKSGWSGVAIYSKIKPWQVCVGISDKKFDQQGRALTLEFSQFYLINAYFPQAGRELLKLPDKLDFNQKFEKYCQKLGKRKPLVIVGDFNVAHQPIDLANPKENDGNAMYTQEERSWFDQFLKKGFIDSFRLFCPQTRKYTWWTWRVNARKRNIGWRIDYFLVSKILKKYLKNSTILTEILGSDHCPIGLEIR